MKIEAFCLELPSLAYLFNHSLTEQKKKKKTVKKRNVQNVLLLDHFNHVLCCHTTLRAFSPKNIQPNIYNI